MDQLWKAAQEETQKDSERVIEAANARVADAVDERDSALTELQSSAEELQAAQSRIAALEGKLRDARQDGEALRAELAGASERAGQAEARVGEIEHDQDEKADRSPLCCFRVWALSLRCSCDAVR